MGVSANLAGWYHALCELWPFCKISRLTNSRTIAKGENVSRLKRKEVNFGSFSIDRAHGKRLDLYSFLEITDTDGLILLHKGGIAFEYYGPRHNEESTHGLMSITKSIVGLLSGILVAQGKLEVNNSVSTYVPEVIGTSFENVTVRQCLDMRAGLACDNADVGYRKACGFMPESESEGPGDLRELLSSFQAPPSKTIDGLGGAAFDYLSINADMVGWILERASGRKLNELVSELIWQPIGAEGDAHMAVDPGGNARAAGGMRATLRDTARIGQLIACQQSSIVPPEWIQDMLHGGSTGAFAAGGWQKGLLRHFQSISYRSFWLSDRDSETFMALGIRGQLMIIDRTNAIVMVKFSSQPSRLDEAKKELAIMAFQEIQRMLLETKDRSEK